MHTRSLSTLILCPALFALGASGTARAHELPAGFELQPIGSDWVLPVGVCFIDGTHMLVAEKQGRVWFVEDDVRKNLVIDLSDETLTPLDRGLLAVEVDPQFAQNGHLYLLYVVDPNADGQDTEMESFSRLTRVTTAFQPDGTLTVVAGSRVDLIGDTWANGIPSCRYSHAIGALRFMSDGSLVLSSGDSSTHETTDAGGFNPGCFGPGKFSLAQDTGAYRAQDDDSYSGKILRVDPATGLGLADNPWFNGNPADVRSRVWAKGLRNPFRFTFVPGSGPRETLVLADVGWDAWEELDLCYGGENFGWPCFEGPFVCYDYLNWPGQNVCPPLEALTPPLLAYQHEIPGELGFTGYCASGVAFYEGDKYPALYRHALFFCDYSNAWLKCARLDQNLAPTQIVDFGTALGGPIDLQSDPASGDLVFISLHNQRIQRLHYVGPDGPPVIVAQVEPRYGSVPLDVHLQASQSHAGDGGGVNFAWDLGDGTTSTLAELDHTYANAGSFTVRLNVTDALGSVSHETFLVTPGNTPPVLTITAPQAGAVFTDGDDVALQATVSDLEDDALGLALEVSWDVTLVHDHEQHPDFASGSGTQGSFTFVNDGPGSNMRARFSAKDASGLTTVHELDLYDATTLPRPHIVSVSDTTLRVGQSITCTGHVHDAGDLHGPATLTWSWGDGNRNAFTGLLHLEDTQISHAYAAVGDYKLALNASAGGFSNTLIQMIHVVENTPAIAVFAPLVSDGCISWHEQQSLAHALEDEFTPLGHEVATFHFDQQAALASWIDAYLDDGVRDVLVVFDDAPAVLFQGQEDGSRLEQWIEHGNGIVWTGKRPFGEYITTNGQEFGAGAGGGAWGASHVLDAPNPGLCDGVGLQSPTLLAAFDLPSLVAFESEHALRYTRLGVGWIADPIYAASAEPNADAVIATHSGGGSYAQVFCSSAAGLPRAPVLIELLHAWLELHH